MVASWSLDPWFRYQAGRQVQDEEEYGIPAMEECLEIL